MAEKPTEVFSFTCPTELVDAMRGIASVRKETLDEAMLEAINLYLNKNSELLALFITFQRAANKVLEREQKEQALIAANQQQEEGDSEAKPAQKQTHQATSRGKRRGRKKLITPKRAELVFQEYYTQGLEWNMIALYANRDFETNYSEREWAEAIYALHPEEKTQPRAIALFGASAQETSEPAEESALQEVQELHVEPAQEVEEEKKDETPTTSYYA